MRFYRSDKSYFVNAKSNSFSVKSNFVRAKSNCTLGKRDRASGISHFIRAKLNSADGESFFGFVVALARSANQLLLSRMLGFFSQLFRSVSAYPKAIAFLNQHRLWRYVLVPAVLYAFLFLALSAAVWQFAEVLGEQLIDWMSIRTLTGLLGDTLSWLIKLLTRLLGFLLYFKLFRYLVLLLASPSLALLAEKTQELLTGQAYPFAFRRFGSDVVRGLAISLKNLLLELSFTLPLYLLSFIPLASPVTVALIIAIESYFVGFAMLDYRNEFRRLSARQSRTWIRQRRGLAIGNGLLFNLLLLIPVVGVLLAPSLGVVAASLSAEDDN